MSKYAAPRFSMKLLGPRYWPTLLLILVMYLLSWLPYVVQRRLGQGIGRLALAIMKKRRFTIERNLELCFPDMTKEKREQIIKPILIIRALPCLKPEWLGFGLMPA